jgi:hypothetical protein
MILIHSVWGSSWCLRLYEALQVMLVQMGHESRHALRNVGGVSWVSGWLSEEGSSGLGSLPSVRYATLCKLLSISGFGSSIKEGVGPHQQTSTILHSGITRTLGWNAGSWARESRAHANMTFPHAGVGLGLGSVWVWRAPGWLSLLLGLRTPIWMLLGSFWLVLKLWMCSTWPHFFIHPCLGEEFST